MLQFTTRRMPLWVQLLIAQKCLSIIAHLVVLSHHVLLKAAYPKVLRDFSLVVLVCNLVGKGGSPEQYLLRTNQYVDS